MYTYVQERRFPLKKVGHTYLISVEDLEHFKRNPTGRLRKQQPAWRVYKGGGALFTTDIEVQVRPGQQARLVEKLGEIRKGKRHTFTGTIARYVLKDRAQPGMVNIWLVWKDTEMPDEGTRQQELAAFKAELADVLDWETARYDEKDGIIYT